MFQLFMDWFGDLSINVSDDVLFIFAAVAAIFILNFILDFFRFVMYYISER